MHPDEYATEQAAETLKAMAHPIRLSMLRALIHDELNVGELCKRMGASQSCTSQHLARLRHAGLVTARRDVMCMYYRVEPEQQAMVKAVFEQLAMMTSREVA